MTQDEIIEMARQAELTKTIDCCGVANKFCSQDQWKGNLSIFAKLVAQHEREACAKIVENEAWQYTSPVWAVEIINDIRARGQA
jgi:hypothetical protein